LKQLEDPEGVFGGGDSHNTMVREGLKEEDPVAYSVLSNYQWEQEDVYEVMDNLRQGMAPKDAADEWIEQNQETVGEWTAEAKEIAASQSSGE